MFHGRADVLGGGLETVHDPAVRHGAIRWRDALRDRFALGVHQHVTGGVPDLVAEIAEAFHAADVELDVAAGRGERIESES